MDADRVYDLSDYSSRDYRNGRVIRWGYGLLGVALALEASIILAYQLVTGTFQVGLHATYGLGYIVPAIAVGVCGFTFVRMGPGAVRLIVTREGVRFIFPSGREFSASWSDPKFHVTLTDYRRNQLAQKYGVLFFARLRGFPHSLISSEAYDTLIGAARENGLVIDLAREGRWWRGNTRDVIQIRSRRP